MPHLILFMILGQYTAFNLIGPASRSLMQQITDTSVTPHQFPPFSCKIINVGYATDIRAISVTHTGELGWVLYVPTLVIFSSISIFIQTSSFLPILIFFWREGVVTLSFYASSGQS